MEHRCERPLLLGEGWGEGDASWRTREPNITCRAMLVSLGGSAEPVLYTLGQQQPEYILFFVSDKSASEIQGIIRELPYECRDFDRILSPSAEILGDCYRALRDHLPSKLVSGVSHRKNC